MQQARLKTGNREREYGGENEARQQINKKQAHFQTITYSWEVFHINLDSPFFPDLIIFNFLHDSKYSGLIYRVICNTVKVIYSRVEVAKR